MAFSEMSAADEHTVHALLKSPQDMMRRHTCRAHDPHGPHIRRVLQTTDPSQVSSRVHSPRTDETDDFRLEIIIIHSLFPFPYIRYPISESGGQISVYPTLSSVVYFLSFDFCVLSSWPTLPESETAAAGV